MAALDDISADGHNLNIPLYVEHADTGQHVTLKHMLANVEAAHLVPARSAWPEDRPGMGATEPVAPRRPGGRARVPHVGSGWRRRGPGSSGNRAGYRGNSLDHAFGLCIESRCD